MQVKLHLKLDTLNREYNVVLFYEFFVSFSGMIYVPQFSKKDLFLFVSAVYMYVGEGL